jgi:hypothetical protein
MDSFTSCRKERVRILVILERTDTIQPFRPLLLRSSEKAHQQARPGLPLNYLYFNLNKGLGSNNQFWGFYCCFFAGFETEFWKYRVKNPYQAGN